MLVIGTVPFDIEIIHGEANLEKNNININGVTFPIGVGTTALLAAAINTLSFFDRSLPYVILAGDKGEGKGTKRLFAFLKSNSLKKERVICGHYMMPYVDEFKEVFPKLRENAKFIIADAGMMYAAKAAGFAKKVDVFTPDVGELAFLADKDAIHPAYIKRILFEIDAEDIESLIRQAYLTENLSKFVFVKGQKDLVIKDGKTIASISSPLIKAMEAIGGTGDTLVGIMSGFLESDFSFEKASLFAAKVNRIAAKLAWITPATPIYEVIKFIPEAIREVVKCNGQQQE
ncbi:MAG TPA: sugar kinase [Candidatus Desulfofervidus auxilii]|uniref:Sugar kinase n=1 Tax=Desulfofervidus auxilii TaxID=1621989 RepID=A0A7V0IAI0_DESA2|nr:sugar kinase [Candidatus Desulfofervidus auxilii]